MQSPVSALEGFWLAQQMKHSLWLYPTVETLHIWGIGALFGSILLLDLRILGFAPGLPADRLSRFAIGVTVIGFGLAVMTGLAMFLTHASEFISSTLFVAKMTLLFLLFINAISLHLRTHPTKSEAENSSQALTRQFDALAKTQALISIFGWAAVIAMGRWLAYV